MIRKVVGIYFSPVGGTAAMTEKLTAEIAGKLREGSPAEITTKVYDLLRMGDGDIVLDDETVAIVGMPVYVGKIPLPGINAIRRIHPNGAITAIAVSYGGRSYGNALYELQHVAEERDFKVIGAGAFSVRYRAERIGKHRMKHGTVDIKAVNEFGNAAAVKIRRLAGSEIEGLKVRPAPVEVDGRLPVHRVSRLSPSAAAIAQSILEKLSIRHRDSEWYL